MKNWYTINSAYGDFYIEGPFKTRREAEYYRADCETRKPKRTRKSVYDTGETIVTTKENAIILGYLDK